MFGYTNVACRLYPWNLALPLKFPPRRNNDQDVTKKQSLGILRSAKPILVPPYIPALSTSIESSTDYSRLPRSLAHTRGSGGVHGTQNSLLAQSNYTA